LQFVLPLIRGEQGYQFGIKQKNSEKNVTAMQFYSYYLQIRDLQSISIHHYGRLFQEYCVDAYSKIEMQRLLWVKSNQKEIRAELYTNLYDLNLNKDINLRNCGRRVILPSSFI
jgi:hypothetical protein